MSDNLENQPLPSMLTLYSRDLACLTPLSHDEQVSFLTHFQPELKHRFIESFLYIPLTSALDICRCNPMNARYLMDFIQEGNEGLLYAVEHTRASTIPEFHVYARKACRGKIYTYFSRMGDIYIPPWSTEERYQILDIEEEEIQNLPAPDESLSTLQLAFQQSAMKRVEELLSGLTLRQQEILRLYYGIGTNRHTSSEIAHDLHIHQSTVQITITRAKHRIQAGKSRRKQKPPPHLTSEETRELARKLVNRVFDTP